MKNEQLNDFQEKFLLFQDCVTAWIVELRKDLQSLRTSIPQKVTTRDLIKALKQDIATYQNEVDEYTLRNMKEDLTMLEGRLMGEKRSECESSVIPFPARPKTRIQVKPEPAA